MERERERPPSPSPLRLSLIFKLDGRNKLYIERDEETANVVEGNETKRDETMNRGVSLQKGGGEDRVLMLKLGVAFEKGEIEKQNA